jgi:hypothetical protein
VKLLPQRSNQPVTTSIAVTPPIVNRKWPRLGLK